MAFLDDIIRKASKAVGDTVNTFNPMRDNNPKVVGKQNFWADSAKNIQQRIQAPRIQMPPFPRYQPISQPKKRKYIAPTDGGYGKGQILDPIKTGMDQLRKPGGNLIDKGMGALSVAQGGLSATLPGMLWNIGSGGVTGIARSLREKKPIGAMLTESINKPASIGSDALGIENPYVAGAIDVGLSRNPKSIIKDPTGIKEVKKIADVFKTKVKGLSGYSPRAFKVHPDDQRVMQDFVIAIEEGRGKANLGQLGQDAQRLAEHYIGKKARGITNEKLAKAFDAILASAAKGRGEDVVQTAFPKMGLVGKSKGEKYEVKPTSDKKIQEIIDKELGSSEVENFKDVLLGNNASPESPAVARAVNKVKEVNAGFSDTTNKALQNPDLEAAFSKLRAYKPVRGGGIAATTDPNTFTPQERSALIHHFKNSTDPLNQKLKGTIVKSYGNQKDLVFGVVRDREYKGQTEYLVMNVGDRAPEHLKGKFRFHSTPISDKDVLQRVDLDEYMGTAGSQADGAVKMITGNGSTTPNTLHAGNIAQQSRVAQPSISQPTSIKNILQSPPERARMSQQAIDEGITTPRTGRDISVSPQAQQRFKTSEAAQPTAQEQASIRDFEKNVLGGTPNREPVKIQDILNQPPKEDNLPQYATADMQRLAGQADFNNAENKKGWDKIFAGWIGKRDAATTTGTQMGYKFKNIPKVNGMDVIKAMEDPTKNVPKNIRSQVEPLHKEFDRLYNEAKKEGVDIGYRENYITHFWDKDELQVKRDYQTFKKKEFIQNEREVPTYEEGIKMGLKPKYTQPAPILADYAQRLEKLKANIQFIKDAKQQGFIVDASVGMSQPGFVPITAPGFPKSISKGIDEKIVTGTYYAPQEIANQINKQFSVEDTGNIGKVFNKTGAVSGFLQDVGLSGGIPYTPMNAFTSAQVQKELLSGRISSPVSSFIRAVSPGKTKEFFNKNAEQIKKMQLRNIPVNSTYRIDDILGAEPPQGLTGWTKEIWNKAMGDPTFNRFMPMLQVNLFNDIEKAALRAKKSPEEAADIAAKAVKNFYGSTDTATAARRMKLTKDVGKTFLFAPRYRESMINFWVNNLKSLKNPLALENRTNIKFLAGSALALGTMNFINEELNGHGMMENPSGKEDKLLIPVSALTGDENDKTVIGVPFLSSIATVPRAIFREGKMLLEGDAKGAATDALSSYSSMLVKPAADILKNEDYFGNQITEETDTPEEKLKKQGEYAFSQYVLGHPYLKEGLTPSNQGDPLYQRASRSMELPFRFYDKDSIAKGEFYNEYYKLKPFSEQYNELSYKDPQKAQEFLEKNKDKIDRFNYMKQVQNAYYEGADAGNSDVSLLSGTGTTEIAPGVTKAGSRIIYTDEDGKYQNIDLTFEPKEPQLTGNEVVDKKLMSKYKGEITSKQNDILKLLEIGAIDEQTAVAQIEALELLRGGSASGSKKGGTGAKQRKQLSSLFNQVADEVRRERPKFTPIRTDALQRGRKLSSILKPKKQTSSVEAFLAKRRKELASGSVKVAT